MPYDALWEEIEKIPFRLETGQLRRRIRPESDFDLFIGLEQPSNERLLLLMVAAHNIGAGKLPSTRTITTYLRRDRSTTRMELELRLLDRRYIDVFSILVDDLIDVVVTAPDEGQAVRNFLTRLEQWQQFLERVGPDGLSEEAQIGLYGELWFLRHHLLTIRTCVQAISAWTGPYATPQDFRLPGCAVEVKTTTVRHPQYVTISNERQLDTAGIGELFLLHLSLEASARNGEVLPEMVEALRDTFGKDAQAKALFEERLIAVGYLNIHSDRYEQTSYSVRNVTFFDVRETFPRLIRENLPEGVSNIQYDVVLSACIPFRVDPSFVHNALLRDEHGNR